MKLIIAASALLVLTCTAWSQESQSSGRVQHSGKALAVQVAHLKPTKDYFVIDIGKDAFRVCDSVVFISGTYLTAKSKIEGVDDSNSVGKFTGIWTRSFKDVEESEIYVINRTDSSCRLVSANLDVARKHADLSLYDPFPQSPQEDKTGKPTIPMVLNINGSVVIPNVGRGCCRNNDTLLVVRISDRGPHVVGNLKVERVYETDAMTSYLHTWGGIRPEDYVFVINSADSDISMARISLAEM